MSAARSCGASRTTARRAYLATDLRVLESVDFSSDATQLPLADGSVDMLIVLEMLEHVPDPSAVVRELARALAPGGIIVLSVPSAVPRHDHHDFWRFTAQGLQQMCEAEFADGEVLVFGGTFETLGYLAAYYVSLLLHVLKFPGRTFRQFFPTVGHAIDRRAGWTTSTSALAHPRLRSPLCRPRHRRPNRPATTGNRRWHRSRSRTLGARAVIGHGT